MRRISTFIILLFTITVSFAGVSRAHFTSDIKNKEPVDNITKLESSYPSIFFYTDTRDCIGCKVEHEWWYEDELQHTQETTAKYKRWRWWSKITPRGRVGEWRVNVKLDGKKKYSKVLEYFAITEQKKAAPIQKRLELQGISNCEKKLKHFNNKLEEYPKDPYYKFMYRKWDSRCNKK